MEIKTEEVNSRLKKFIENIERIEEDKKELARQISDIFKEAKSAGFDTKAIRRILSLRKMELDKRVELEQLTEIYKEALGMLD